MRSRALLTLGLTACLISPLAAQPAEPCDGACAAWTLRVGARGPRVTQLQRLLVALGEQLVPNARFDAPTWVALRRLQRAHALEVTGQLDGPTRKLLARLAAERGVAGLDELAEAAPRATGVSQPLPLPGDAPPPGEETPDASRVGLAGMLAEARSGEEPAADPGESEPPATAVGLEQVRAGAVLGEGDRGPGVRAMQELLGKAGFPVQATGVFGPTTAATLERFQRAHDVQPTRRLGPTTLGVLERAAREGTVWPARGVITSRYGWRSRGFHHGIDIANNTGTPIVAMSSGRVEVAGYYGNAGNMVRIVHPNGARSRYLHLSRIDVRVGQQVGRGQTVGLMGSTGRSTGPHLHFEYWADGWNAVNPESHLPRR